MSLSTIQKPEQSPREKIQELRKHHQPVFDALGNQEALFIPKLVYRPAGKDEMHFSMFIGELGKGQDVYTEFVSKDIVPEDMNRTLWMWRFNPHWEEEYDTTEPMANGQVRYLIPAAELVKVNVDLEPKAEVKTAGKSPATPLKLDFDEIMNPDTDASIDQLSIRDLAAILWKKPVSTKKWLNELIKTQ
jgi:hypothetical protein